MNKKKDEFLLVHFCFPSNLLRFGEKPQYCKVFHFSSLPIKWSIVVSLLYDLLKNSVFEELVIIQYMR